jgi:hypothetical protein
MMQKPLFRVAKCCKIARNYAAKGVAIGLGLVKLWRVNQKKLAAAKDTLIYCISMRRFNTVCLSAYSSTGLR